MQIVAVAYGGLCSENRAMRASAVMTECVSPGNISAFNW